MRLHLLALGVLLVGCAGTTTSPALPLGTDPSAPLAAPVDFPVDAVPRPIVLIGPPLVVVESVGTNEEKMAVGTGRVSFTGTEPPTPGPSPVVLPDGPATLPLIGVRDALDAMSAAGREGEPLELVGVELGAAAFQSDRGILELPAWLFRASLGTLVAWPAVTPEAFWKYGEAGFSMHQATTSDGVELEVRLPAPAPPCPGEEQDVMEPVVTEGANSVTVGVRTVVGGAGTCTRDAMYRSQLYTITLKEPLGARLLLDDQNNVITVTTP